LGWGKHLLETVGNRSSHGGGNRSPLGKRFRRRSAHEQGGEFCFAVYDEVARLEENLSEPAAARSENARRRSDGRLLSSLHIQSQSARKFHRYAAPWVFACQARGPHASQLGDR